MQPTDAVEERRQITALFCDVVGATELSASLDPEDYFELLRGYHARVAELVAAHGGHVAQFLGDGVLAYFGYPAAYEDSVERAVRAGLAIVGGRDDRDAGASGLPVPVSVRVGIHTGAVVLGQTGGDERGEVLALGETPNLAARLQAAAAANSVVVSGDSERLVRGLFVTEDLGPQRLKGFARPVRAFRVVAPSGTRSRLDALGAERLTPFVGREAELRRLLAAWEGVRAGRGGAVAIAGEPGIGKSRLARALRDAVAATPHVWLEAQCSQWTQNTAFYPVVELQRRRLGLGSETEPAAALARLEAALQGAGLPVDEALPLVALLHDLALPPDRQPPPTSREAQRRRTLETLADWLRRVARTQPVVVVLEDVQWIDPSTAELVTRVGHELDELPLLLVVTHRPDYALDWLEPDVELRLEPLAEAEAALIVEQVATGDTASRERVHEILARAEGVPLYLEELTKAVVEHDVDVARGRAPARAPGVIPATLRDSLRARLDRLGPARELALLGSVIGREFSYALLLAASSRDEPELRAGLERLVERELVYQSGRPPDAVYRFKHALIRDEAYQSLVRPARSRYHRSIAEALESGFPRETATRPELLAHHFLEAGDGDKGVEYLALAARHAVVRSANVEALHHADRALDELRRRPPSSRRDQLELTLCTLRGSALIATRGYASAEVQQTFARARELVSAASETPQLVPVLHGLWLFHMVRGDREATGELAAQLLAIAEATDDATARLFGFTVAGIQGFFEGRFRRAVDYVDRAFALYDSTAHSQLAATHSLETAGVARANAATCLWLLGRPDRARELVHDVVAEARDGGHTFTHAGACVMGAMVFHLCRDPAAARALEEEALAIATDESFPLWVGAARCGLGQSIAELGELDEGLELIRQGLTMFRATGAQTNVAFVLAGIATLCMARGRLDEAQQAVDEGLALVERNLETFYAAELWRLHGEVALARGDEDAAGASFDRALSLARAEEARSLELRAATSIARLAQRQGDTAKGVEVLARVYESFEEGLDTADLRDAGALLESLRVAV